MFLSVTTRALMVAETLLLTPRARQRAGLDEIHDDADDPFAFLDGGA